MAKKAAKHNTQRARPLPPTAGFPSWATYDKHIRRSPSAKEIAERERQAKQLEEDRKTINRDLAIRRGLIPASAPLPRNTKEWLTRKVAEHQKAGNIPDGITAFSKELAEQMNTDAKTTPRLRPAEARGIENRLRELGLWPLKK